ncbi:MAG: hypothetical protein KatS3mg102_0291 [Planctomycetota bacterium]|nr:MAG: hypothetical protein KatS3mg102_0291 [Planctomycetota bacterium]
MSAWAGVARTVLARIPGAAVLLEGMADGAAPVNPVRRAWDWLAPLPGGRRLFSLAIGRAAPYTATIRPLVEELRPGFARVRMRDRRAVRNHLGSVHAVALVNLAEVASGVAMMYALPPGARGILTGLSIEYLKKARGTLTATGRCPVPQSAERREYEAEAEIRNRAGEVVARARARWLVGPPRQAGASQERPEGR